MGNYDFMMDCDFQPLTVEDQPKRGPEVYTSPDQIKVGDIVVHVTFNGSNFTGTDFTTSKVMEVDDKFIYSEYVVSRIGKVSSKIISLRKDFLSDRCLIPYLPDNVWNSTNYLRRVTPKGKAAFEKAYDQVYDHMVQSVARGSSRSQVEKEVRNRVE